MKNSVKSLLVAAAVTGLLGAVAVPASATDDPQKPATTQSDTKDKKDTKKDSKSKKSDKDKKDAASKDKNSCKAANGCSAKEEKKN